MKKRPTTVRGLPYKDYLALWRLVKMGKTTWKALEKREVVRRKRRRQNKFAEEAMKKVKP